jgi:RNA-binding protein YhbY
MRSKIAVIVIALLCLALMPVFCALEPQTIPEKWRCGDQAIYLLSFPYPSYETRVVNETTGETIVIEKPAEVVEITVILCAWNVSEENPIIVSVDQDENKIVREGYYVLTFKPPPGLHSLAIYSEYKIYEQAVVRVKPPPPLPLMITWEEFLKRLKEAREEIIRNLLIASAAGIALGIFLKRKTRIFTYWVPFALAWLNLPPYLNPVEYYPLFGLGVASIIAYWLCPPFARWLGVLTVDESGQSLTFTRIPRDEKGLAILDISPRYIKRGFMLKKKVEVKDPYPIGFEIDGEMIETVVAMYVKEKEDKIVIHGSSSLARALVDSGLVEKLSQDLADARVQLHLLKRAGASLTAYQVKEIEDVFRESELVKVKTWRDMVREAKKAEEEVLEKLGLRREEAKPEEKAEKAEGGEKGEE